MFEKSTVSYRIIERPQGLRFLERSELLKLTASDPPNSNAAKQTVRRVSSRYLRVIHNKLHFYCERASLWCTANNYVCKFSFTFELWTIAVEILFNSWSICILSKLSEVGRGSVVSGLFVNYESWPTTIVARSFIRPLLIYVEYEFLCITRNVQLRCGWRRSSVRGKVL